MAKLSIYKKFYNIKDEATLVKKFQETLMMTNKTYSYFVDWVKIKKNVTKYEYEINILNYLIGFSNIKNKLKEILKKNPEVLPVIPLMIAVRDSNIAIIENPLRPIESLLKFNFNKKKSLCDEEIERIINFCDKAGILSLFSDFKMKNLRDFLLGVETGIDTNARKNRSGKAMENLITPILDDIKGIKCFTQKTFKHLKEKENLNVPRSLLNRKFDYVIIFRNKHINMEVNYYDGQGSKPQEIVDSYINRKNELANENWDFIWLTDGIGWKTGTNQLTNAFENMDYVLNIEFARKGMLDSILKTL